MEPSSQPDVFRRTFSYSPLGYAVAVPMLLFFAWFVIDTYLKRGWSGSLIFLALLVPGAIFEWAMQPTSFEEEGETLTACWIWGRRRSWKLKDLTIPGVSRRWALGLAGYVSVHLRAGGKAFNVGVQLEDFEEFVELIEPGSRKKNEPETKSTSWWNRDLLK